MTDAYLPTANPHNLKSGLVLVKQGFVTLLLTLLLVAVSIAILLASLRSHQPIELYTALVGCILILILILATVSSLLLFFGVLQLAKAMRFSFPQTAALVILSQIPLIQYPVLLWLWLKASSSLTQQNSTLSVTNS